MRDGTLSVLVRHTRPVAIVASAQRALGDQHRGRSGAGLVVAIQHRRLDRARVRSHRNLQIDLAGAGDAQPVLQ